MHTHLALDCSRDRSSFSALSTDGVYPEPLDLVERRPQGRQLCWTRPDSAAVTIFRTSLFGITRKSVKKNRLQIHTTI